MKSTHRRNEDLMRQAVVEAQTSIERVKVSHYPVCTRTQAVYISIGRDIVCPLGVCMSVGGCCV